MKILVVDDEPGLRQTVSRILGAEGHTVGTASEGDEALTRLATEDVDLVLCDLRMPKMDGLEFIERYTSGGGHALVIAMSAYGDSDTAIAAMQKGAYDYVQKPFRAEEVVLAVRKAAEREKLRAKVEELEDQLSTIRGADEIIGHSASIKAALDMARKVARHPSTVLITGESGTGKELVARLVHRSSPRAEKAFVAVNCGAIPEALLESELFGHVKGSFTSADRDKMGLFEEASGGTLFLDEIGELPSALQVKLLRALQEGEVRRVGATTSQRIDARVVAATNRDLGVDVASGRFRGDLYYRVNVVTIRLPPLRERAQDVPELRAPLPSAVQRPAGSQGRIDLAAGHANAHGLLVARERARAGECDRARAGALRRLDDRARAFAPTSSRPSRRCAGRGRLFGQAADRGARARLDQARARTHERQPHARCRSFSISRIARCSTRSGTTSSEAEARRFN